MESEECCLKREKREGTGYKCMNAIHASQKEHGDKENYRDEHEQCWVLLVKCRKDASLCEGCFKKDAALTPHPSCFEFRTFRTHEFS